MADKTNTTFVNFVGGEVGPLVKGRSDLELYLKSLQWCQNFILLPGGGARYRPGTRMVGLTKNNRIGKLIPFQFSADDGLMIMATVERFRFYRDGAVILNDAVTITDITETNPAVVTAAAHGYSNGDEVYIEGVAGMTQVNGRFFIVQGVTTNTFQLTDPFGVNVNATAYDDYDTAGSVSSIYEVETPYLEDDLDFIRWAQTADIMYLVCNNSEAESSYAPRKLIRNDFTDWTLGTYKRVNDPFRAATKTVFVPTAITAASPPVVTVASTTGLTNDDTVYASGIVGMTELNGRFFAVKNKTATTFELYDPGDEDDGGDTVVDGTAYTAFSNSGASRSFTLRTRDPGAVAFSADGRLVFANTAQNPEGWWASMLPTVAAKTRYDTFTIGSSAKHAMAFNFSPVDDKMDGIQEMKQFGGNMALLGAGSVRQIYGPEPGVPPTATAINTIPAIQGSARVRPLIVNWDLLFVDVNRQRLRGLQYNLQFNTYVPLDYNLAAEHVGLESPMTKIAFTKGVPDVVWVLREDGALFSLTFNNIENIAAWARHYVGADGVVLDIQTIRNGDGFDELWMIVERTMGADEDSEKTFRSIEIMSQWPQFPRKLDYYTGTENEESDRQDWEDAAWEAGKDSVFLDMVIEYDGRRDAVLIVTDVSDPVFVYEGYTRVTSTPGYSLLLDESGDYLYVAAEDIATPTTYVLKIRTDTGEIVDRSEAITVGFPVPFQILFNGDKSRVFVLYGATSTSNPTVKTLSVADMTTVNTTVLEVVGSVSWLGAVSPDGGTLAVFQRGSLANTKLHTMNTTTFGVTTAAIGTAATSNGDGIAFFPGDSASVYVPAPATQGSITKYNFAGAALASYVVAAGNDLQMCEFDPVTTNLFTRDFTAPRTLRAHNVLADVTVGSVSAASGNSGKFVPVGDGSMYTLMGNFETVYKFNGSAATTADFPLTDEGLDVDGWNSIAYDDNNNYLYTQCALDDSPFSLVIQRRAAF